jgi:hypothetical protein
MNFWLTRLPPPKPPLVSNRRSGRRLVTFPPSARRSAMPVIAGRRVFYSQWGLLPRHCLLVPDFRSRPSTRVWVAPPAQPTAANRSFTHKPARRNTSPPHRKNTYKPAHPADSPAPSTLLTAHRSPLTLLLLSLSLPIRDITAHPRAACGPYALMHSLLCL